MQIERSHLCRRGMNWLIQSFVRSDECLSVCLNQDGVSVTVFFSEIFSEIFSEFRPASPLFFCVIAFNERAFLLACSLRVGRMAA